MPTLSSMDEECWGPESPSKEVCSINVTTSSCFLHCGGGPRDLNGQCQDVCVRVCGEGRILQSVSLRF